MKLKMWLIPLAFTLVALMIIWVTVAEDSPVRVQAPRSNATELFGGWQSIDSSGAYQSIAIPARLSSDTAAITHTLPVSIFVNQYLYIKTNYQPVSAQVEGVEIPTVGIAATSGNRLHTDLPWTAIPLQPEMGGKNITLQFTGEGSKPNVEVYAIHFGYNSRIQLNLLSGAQMPVIISVLIILFAGILFSFAWLEAHRYGRKLSASYFYLLLFVITAGIWFYTETDVSAVSYLANSTFLMVNLFSRLLMPLPFLAFTYTMQPKFKKLARGLTLLFALHALLQALLIMFGQFSYLTAVTVYHIMIAATILLITFQIITKSLPLGEDLAAGVLIITIASLVTLLASQMYPLEDNAIVFRYAVMILVVTLTISVLRSNVDILMQAKSIEQLRIHEEEYRIAVRQSDKHVVRYDVAKRTLLRGDESIPLFGGMTLVEDMPESAIAAGYIGTESVADFRKFFASITSGQPSGSCTGNMRREDGSFGWFHADYTTIFSAAGEPLQAVISIYDVTDQRDRELAYQKWKQTYAEMPSSGMNYYEYNLTRDVFTSEAGSMLPPLPALVRMPLRLAVDYLADQHVLPADDQVFRSFFDRDQLLGAYARGVHSDSIEFRRTDAQGYPLWTRASVQLISDPFANDVHAFLLLKDDDQRKRAELEMHARSNMDPLTGLLNRTAFAEQLTELASQNEPGSVHALLMIDIDGFKRVNDNFGHQFGDHVLIDVASSLRAMMRGDDLISRIGGDEFMVCLKNVRDSSGFLERRATYICQALNKQFGSDVSISGSVGLALYPRDGVGFETLYLKADRALYFAKHHGKNRFVFFTDSMLGGEGNPPSMTLMPTPAPLQEEPESIALVKRTLLIVDDVAMNRDLLAEIFGDEYQLLLADSAKQCLLLMERHGTEISAVLLDLIMPDMSGLDVLSRLQGDVFMASIPVIVISAANEVEYSIRAIELGATDFVSKPIDPRLVRLRVKNAIHKRETEDLRAQNRYLLVQKSDESRHQDELRHLAEHDPLTNIWNKETFYHKTQQMLAEAPETSFVMISFDIEKFRVINDIFGHAEGDRLLQYIARRIHALYAGKGTYGRISSDNFALCLPYHAEHLRQRIAENEKELKSYHLPFEVMLVYGLYLVEDRTVPVHIMHDRAVMAKRTVKGNYVNRYAYYDEQLRQTLLDELEIVNNMNTALEESQFEVYLQPKCTLCDGEIIGAEALVRWNHPTRGLLSPGSFVPLFERNGFIMKLDAFVWEQVCILIRKWMDDPAGRHPLPVSMNVSRVNIYNPQLVDTLCNLSDKYGVPRRFMELEITESAYAEDPKQLSALIAELRRRGFVVEMDDFGSAYSSLNMLKEISVDLLKLDMHFLFGNDLDGRGGTILSSIVRMARYLSLPIVAEGVENAQQARFLCSIGCSVGQGYYYYHPMPIADFETLIAQNPIHDLPDVRLVQDESEVRRVWSIDGDFSLMLSTIPCAASVCELFGDHIEILRINDEYIAMTGDSQQRIYDTGTDVRRLTTPEDYDHLLTLMQQMKQDRQPAQMLYHRYHEDGTLRGYVMKLHYLSGDDVRNIFFITYRPVIQGRDEA